jgi:DNA-binding MarR family transcriptional regulator
VKRVRNGQDRRVVTNSITAEGLRKLEALDQPVNALPIQQFKGLSRQKILELIRTLEILRQRDL